MSRVLINTDRLLLAGCVVFPEWLCAHGARIGPSGFDMQQAAIQIDVKVPIGLMAHFYFLACVATACSQRRQLDRHAGNCSDDVILAHRSLVPQAEDVVEIEP